MVLLETREKNAEKFKNKIIDFVIDMISFSQSQKIVHIGIVLEEYDISTSFVLY